MFRNSLGHFSSAEDVSNAYPAPCEVLDRVAAHGGQLVGHGDGAPRAEPPPRARGRRPDSTPGQTRATRRSTREHPGPLLEYLTRGERYLKHPSAPHLGVGSGASAMGTTALREARANSSWSSPRVSGAGHRTGRGPVQLRDGLPARHGEHPDVRRGPGTPAGQEVAK